MLSCFTFVRIYALIKSLENNCFFEDYPQLERSSMDQGLLTIIIILTLLLTAAVLIYAALAWLSTRRPSINRMKKRQDTNGLLRHASDVMNSDTLRLESLQALAELGAQQEDIPLLKKAAAYLVGVFKTCEGKKCKLVLDKIYAVERSVHHPAFHEALLEELMNLDWALKGESKRSAVVSLLNRLLSAENSSETSSPANVQAWGTIALLSINPQLIDSALKKLQDCLQDQDAGQVREAVKALTNVAISTREPLVAETSTAILVEALQSSDNRQRIFIVKAIGYVASHSRQIRLRARITDALVIALQDQDPEIRSTAVELLKGLNTRTVETQVRARIADALIIALQNPDLYVRRKAASALNETYLWAEDPDRRSRTVRALTISLLDADQVVSRTSAAMLQVLEPQIKEDSLRGNLLEAFLAALHSRDEELVFLSARLLAALYQSNRLPEGLREMVHAEKERINAAGVMSVDDRVGKCSRCGKEVPLKHARLIHRKVEILPALENPAVSHQERFRYFCPDCFLENENDWPEGSLLGPDGKIIEDLQPPRSLDW